MHSVVSSVCAYMLHVHVAINMPYVCLYPPSTHTHITCAARMLVVVGIVMSVEGIIGSREGKKGGKKETEKKLSQDQEEWGRCMKTVEKELVGWLEKNNMNDPFGYFNKLLVKMADKYQVSLCTVYSILNCVLLHTCTYS